MICINFENFIQQTIKKDMNKGLKRIHYRDTAFQSWDYNGHWIE